MILLSVGVDGFETGFFYFMHSLCCGSFRSSEENLYCLMHTLSALYLLPLVASHYHAEWIPNFL